MVKAKVISGDIQLIVNYTETKDEKIFSELYKFYFPLINRYVENMIDDHTMSFDLTQEVFIKISQKIDSLKNPKTFKHWAYRIAHNICMDYFRQASRKRKVIEGYTYLNSNEVQNHDLKSLREFTLRDDRIEKLPVLMALLNNEEQELLNIKYIQNKTIIEIAESLNVGSSAVKMKLQRTKKKVAKYYLTA